MTTKLIETEAGLHQYVSELVNDAHDVAHGVEHLNQNFELSPLRQQALTEAVALIDRVVSTLEAVR